MVHVIVRERDAEVQATEPITSGSVGLAVRFHFSPDWDGMGKVVTFKGSGASVDVALSGTSCELPHEVLASAGGHLKIGVYGTKNAGQQVTPTVWADAGPILEGAEPSELDPTPATESLVQQILEAAENAEAIARSVRDDADAGEFDGAAGPQGEQGPAGKDGAQIWWTDRVQFYTSQGQRTYYTAKGSLRGKSGAAAAVGDYVYGPQDAALSTADPDAAFLINRIQGSYAYLTFICSIKGEKGDKGDKGDKGEDGATPTADAELSASSTNPVQNKVITAALGDKAAAIIETANGATASFPDGADGLPVKDLTIAIEPVQSGSGDPSPDNVRTISGRTDANVWDDPVHGGSIVWNQYAKELNSTNWEPGNGTDTYTDGVARYEITTVGSTYYANKISTRYSFTGYELHKYYAAFTHRENKTGMLISFTYVASNCGAIANSSTDWVRSEAIGQIAAGQGGANKWLAVRYNNGTGAGAATREVGDWFEAKDMVFIDLTLMFGAGNEPSTVEEFKALFPKEYYAYNNGTTTCVSAVNGDPYWTEAISWQSEAGTVYGGTLDVTTGVLTVDKKMLDLGTRSWRWITSISQFMCSTELSDLLLPPSNAYAMDAVCDCYKVISYQSMSLSSNNVIFLPGAASGPSKFLRIKDSRFSEDADGAAALKTYLSGHYLCYKVENPTTYQLTPQQLSTLLGDNNIWADTGDTTVQYRADTKLYIAAIEDENRQLRLTIAPIEDGDTASQAYAQGKYFFRNGSFCKAKTSIASGASFTLNTNYEVTTVSAELFAALNS